MIGDTENPIYFTNGLDFSNHLKNAIGNPDAFYKEFPIQGTQGYKHPEAAKEFFSVYNMEVKVNKLPGGLIGFLALFKKEFKMVKHMSDYLSRSREIFLAEDYGTYSILGYPSYSLKDYAQKLKKEKCENSNILIK